MITTREITVDLNKEKLKLRGATTKNIDAGVRVEPPKAKIKPRGVTSTTLADVGDIREKKRRDDIAIEKKLMIKDAKKLAMKEEKKKPWNKMNAKERKEHQAAKKKERLK